MTRNGRIFSRVPEKSRAVAVVSSSFLAIFSRRIDY